MDGQPIKVLTTLEEGNPSIQGLMPNGTLIPISLPMPETRTIISDTTASTSLDNKPHDEKHLNNMVCVEIENHTR